MSEISAFWFVFGLFLGGAIMLICWLQSEKDRRISIDDLPLHDPHVIISEGHDLEAKVSEQIAALKAEQSAPNDFEVNGPPRRKPWVVRKRELEEAARTKRKKLESFSEYV
jgi:hypothetical protein